MFLNKKIANRKEKNMWVVLSTVFFYLLTHGYRMSNNLYSHDALLEIVQDDSAWQIALGRFMQPILLLVRGGIGSPWLLGCGAMIWICVALWLLVELFRLNSPLSIVLTSGILICNFTYINNNASYLNCIDFYAMALALSVLGVYLCCKKGILGKLLGILSMTVSMGIYQAYICVSISLFMICILLSMEETPALEHNASKRKKHSSGKKTPAFFSSDIFLGIKYSLCLLVSAGIYYSIWKFFQRMFHIWTSDSYNGLASVGTIDNNIFSLISGAYRAVFEYLYNPAVFITINYQGQSLSFSWTYLLRICNCLLLVKLVWDLIQIKKAQKTSLLIALMDVLLFLLFPLGMNFVYVLSKGMEHGLMIFAFQMFYFFIIVCNEKKPEAPKKDTYRQLCLLIPIAAIIWCNIVYANQTYLKKNLQETAMVSLMTRIVAQLEQTEGYIPGVTPVAFSGEFENSPCVRSLPGFEEIAFHGMGNSPLTYQGTDYAFLKYIINVPINETRVYADDPAVLQMPVYPEKGSIQYVDGVLVVKISE